MNENLVASHTPASTDANHVFSLSNGELKVTIPDGAGSGEDYSLDDGSLYVNPGFSGSATAAYEFTDEPTLEIDFEYNHNGLRTQKRVVENGITTIYDYTLHGKLITHLTKRVVDLDGAETDKEELHFFYDAQGRPAFIKYEGTMYRYIHNLQGDIVAIVDAAGNPVVEYKYDAWGKQIGLMPETGIGAINPFRYRGYILDCESDLYYLTYRYYSAVENRFINLDEFGGSKWKLISHNAYCYCMNSPICQKDEMGRMGGLAFGLLLVAIAVGVSGCSTGDYSGAANCYAYALKLTVDPKTEKPFTKKPNPGSFSGNPLSNSDLKKLYVKKEIISRVETDCAVLNLTIEEVTSNAYVCQEGEWIIALAFAPDYDYHWYRKDEDGTWSHKPGVTAVSRVDQTGNTIYDPQVCDRGAYYEFLVIM